MPQPTGESRLARADTRLATAMSRRLVDAIARDGGRRRFAFDRVAVTVLCVPVHAVTLAFAAGGVLLLTLGDSWAARFFGVLSLLVAVALIGPTRLRSSKRERESRRRTRGPGLIDPESRPATRALVIEIARLVGSPVPDRVEVLPDVNAYAMRRRRRRVLGYGAPLWLAEDRGGRIATLAHELGHFAHGDLLQGWYVGTAVDTLDRWIDIFEVDRNTPMGPILPLLTWPVRALLSGYRRLIELAAAPSHRRQEHYADLASAVAAGTGDAVAGLEVLLAVSGIDVAANRAAITHTDLDAAILEFRDGFDAGRRAGARRRGDLEKSRIDDSHPPTMERIRLLESGEPLPAAVTRTDEEWARIEAEWAAGVASQLARLAERYRYVR